MRALNRILALLLIVLFVMTLAFFTQTNYILFMPGSAEALRPLITVEGAEKDLRGQFYMVTVNQRRANLLTLLYGYLHPHIEVRQLVEVIPKGMTQAEYRELLNRWMNESKMLAKLIALQKTGYEVEFKSVGTMIVGFLDGSPAQGILKEGDYIVAVDGKEVRLADEVISAVRDRQIGEAVDLTILRDGEEHEVTVITTTNPGAPDYPALGVYIHTLYSEPIFPVEITMETGKVGGPSAGLMFVLEIIDQLTPGDLTGGHKVAGTGTIDLDENVGRIGGVFQKVIAAEREGAEYFIVPEGNYDEARQAARRIKLVPVSTLQDALDFLESLSGSAGTLSHRFAGAA